MELTPPFGGASSHCNILQSRGADRDRTDDLFVANESLSQLSYSPGAKYSFCMNFAAHPFQLRSKFQVLDQSFRQFVLPAGHPKLSHNITKNRSEFKANSLPGFNALKDMKHRQCDGTGAKPINSPMSYATSFSVHEEKFFNPAVMDLI